MRVGKKPNYAYWISCSLLALCGTGCGSSGGGPSKAETAAYENRIGADEGAAGTFVKNLQALPPAQRQAYASQHPADVRNMALVQNQDLQMTFRKLMLNR